LDGPRRRRIRRRRRGRRRKRRRSRRRWMMMIIQTVFLSLAFEIAAHCALLRSWSIRDLPFFAVDCYTEDTAGFFVHFVMSKYCQIGHFVLSRLEHHKHRVYGGAAVSVGGATTYRRF
jgi:hypothetical protein